MHMKEAGEVFLKRILKSNLKVKEKRIIIINNQLEIKNSMQKANEIKFKIKIYSKMI